MCNWPQTIALTMHTLKLVLFILKWRKRIPTHSMQTGHLCLSGDILTLHTDLCLHFEITWNPTGSTEFIVTYLQMIVLSLRKRESMFHQMGKSPQMFMTKPQSSLCMQCLQSCFGVHIFDILRLGAADLFESQFCGQTTVQYGLLHFKDTKT